MSALARSVAALIVLACVATGCSAAKTPPATRTARTSSRRPRVASVVALGDSVPRGTNCDCEPYPPLTAADVGASAHRKVTATNDAVNGATTGSVLAQLKSDDAVIAHVRTADLIEIEVGANDVGYSSSCGTKVDCYAPELPTVTKNLRAIVDRVHQLTSGREVVVALLDYWNVWLGGKYAAAKGQAYVDAAEEMTDRVNTIVKTTASDTGSHYVDLRAAFKGPGYSYDETHYLSNDGDHPNAAGHRRIAAAVEDEVAGAFR